MFLSETGSLKDRWASLSMHSELPRCFLFQSKFVSKKGFSNTEVILEELCKFTILGEAQVSFCTALCLEFVPKRFCGNGCEIGKKLRFQCTTND